MTDPHPYATANTPLATLAEVARWIAYGLAAAALALAANCAVMDAIARSTP